MIRLNQPSSQLISLITAQNGANVVVNYSDKTSTTYNGDSQVTNITSATTTTICATPAASTIRDVDHISIRNTFAGSQAITVQLSSSATLYPLLTVTLAQGDSLEFTHGSGWQVIDSNGAVKIGHPSLTGHITTSGSAALLGSFTLAQLNTAVSDDNVVSLAGTETITGAKTMTGANVFNGTLGATTPAAVTATTGVFNGDVRLGSSTQGAVRASTGGASLAHLSPSVSGGSIMISDDTKTAARGMVIADGGAISIGNGLAVTGAISATTTLTALGDTLIGKTDAANTVVGIYLSNGGAANFTHTTAGDGPGSQFVNIAGTVASGYRFASFRINAAATQVGTITTNGSNATSYNTSSDYRLKNITGPLTGSGVFIDALKPRQGTWKVNGSPFVGFVAHEFQAVSPGSVTGKKDGMRDEEYEITPAVQGVEAKAAVKASAGVLAAPAVVGVTAVPAVMGVRVVPDMQAMQAGTSEVIANIVAELQDLRKRLAAAGIA